MKVTGGTAVGVSPPAGFFGAAGYSVNTAGVTVGRLFGTGGNNRSFIHTDAGGFEQLPLDYFSAVGINNAGQIAGTFIPSGGFETGYRRAPDGTRTPIGALFDASEGRAINSLGTVFGTAGDGHIQAAVRFTGGGPLQRLESNEGQNIILGANDGNFAVGYEFDTTINDYDAVLWRPDGTLVNLEQWLNTAFPALGARWDLQKACDVNNTGFIVGEGVYQDPTAGPSSRAFLLDARSLGVVPEPGGSCLMAAAATLLAGTRRDARRRGGRARDETADQA
jgi:hypothetical protein